MKFSKRMSNAEEEGTYEGDLFRFAQSSFLEMEERKGGNGGSKGPIVFLVIDKRHKQKQIEQRWTEQQQQRDCLPRIVIIRRSVPVHTNKHRNNKNAG